jgi:hypothetical protein
MSFARAFFALGTALTAASLSACGDPVSLTPATEVNVVDTVQLYALRGTAVSLPSGFDVPTRSATRTDTPNFDFAFDITDAGVPQALPAGALGLSAEPGLLLVTQGFEAVESAPTEEYVLTAALNLEIGMVFVVRSRPFGTGCILTGALPRYGKFRVLALDQAARTVTLEMLVNQNCGYRNLQPGLPTD